MALTLCRWLLLALLVLFSVHFSWPAGWASSEFLVNAEITALGQMQSKSAWDGVCVNGRTGGWLCSITHTDHRVRNSNELWLAWGTGQDAESHTGVQIQGAS